MMYSKWTTLYSWHIKVVVVGLILQFFLLLHMQYKTTMEEVDRRLYIGAYNIKYYLGEDFISKNLNRNSFSADETFEKFPSLHEKGGEVGVDYLYLIIRDGDEAVYAALSDTPQEIGQVKNNGFWLSLSEAEDDSLHETLEAFDSSKPVYLESSDMWDTYRSIYLPQISLDGVKYLAGADITISNLKKEVLLRTLKIFLPFLGLFIILIPLGRYLARAFWEREKLEDHIDHLNKKDLLTGVYNRKQGLQLLSHYLNRSHSSTQLFSIFLVGIDNLDSVNKNLGMKAGDNLLIILINILRNTFRKSDNIMRLEGNKFLVMLEDFDPASLEHINKTISERVDYFNKHNKNSYFMRVNYILHQYHGEKTRDFLESALLELRYLKDNRNSEERKMQADILKGIRQKEFKTYFQPKVDLEGEEISFEALVRWLHPIKGTISPSKFIPLAERSSVINEITKIVLEDSLRAAETLGKRISINLSPISLDNDVFFKEILEVLKNSKFSDLISFEITERSAINNFEKTLIKIRSLNKVGSFVSIDDFGIGYSSLSYLDMLPVREVKIDKLFIENITLSKINAVIVKAVIDMGRVKGFKVTCEGVETLEQIRVLSRLGCRIFQGYFFGKAEKLSVVAHNLNSETYLKKMRNIKLMSTKKQSLRAIND